MNTLPRPRPLVVIILDGWGISLVSEGNAIAQAKTPTMDQFAYYFPTAALSAASSEVGLPWGEVGNSETGHRNIGAGHVQYQVLPLIDQAITDGSFFTNPVLLKAFTHIQDKKTSLHLMGLASPSGVHAHLNHLFALLQLAARQGLHDRVYIHLFTDGRDSPPQSALLYLEQLDQVIKSVGVGTIASVSGRFYAMDRNENWERITAVYNLLTGGPRDAGAASARQAIEHSYQQGVFDEMIAPVAITRGGSPVAEIHDGDAVIFFNFRPDRARQLTAAFTHPDFKAFPTKKFRNLYFATMSDVDPENRVPAAWQEPKAEYPLARVIAAAGLSQLHIAETEKYAHITYYLNVGHEELFPGEKHVLIKSSAVKNFADKPQMAAAAITDQLIKDIEARAYDVYFVNYANADMVGHSGNFDATVTACEFVDTCLGRLLPATFKARGALLVTADHGNAEEKMNLQTHEVETDHTNNPVPLHYVHPALQRTTPRSADEVTRTFSAPIGVLADVAPTILEILQLAKPASMTGISLLNSLQ